MSEFNTEDYLSGMNDADKFAQEANNLEGGDFSESHNAPSQSEECDVHTECSDSCDCSNEQSQDTCGDCSCGCQVSDKESSPQDKSEDTADTSAEDSLTPLGKAKAEAAEYLEALQRERAAFVNFRNRSSKEQERSREHGVVDVLTALLPALDDIDRIRTNNALDDSFAAVAAKIDKTFEKFGVEKFGVVGETFDPTRHEGILRKPDSEVTEEVVDTVVEAGYKIGDRVIRAARVVVAVPEE